MIDIKIGDVVEYIGCSKEQVNWGGNDDPSQSFLIIGREYIVSDVEVHSQHTKVSVLNKSGRFNSVCFRKVSSE
jgi:hypothetical protein